MIPPTRICIILTSTIRVNKDKVGLVQIDADERRKLYLSRVKQWLNCTQFKIILVENSGYTFPELQDDANTYKSRFEICSYDESTLDEASYLKNDRSKGCSELFAINYAYEHSNIAKSSDYIIKITSRYFISGLEKFILRTNLEDYVAMTQHNEERCELVGCKPDFFNVVFFVKSLDETGNRHGHVERVYKIRMNNLRNHGNIILTCPEFPIEPTMRGGVHALFINI